MTEIRRVSYTLTGEAAPVIHLECRSAEEARQAYMLATAMSREEMIAAHIDSLRQFLTAPIKPSKRMGIVYTPSERVQIWAANYIQCGPCKRAWDEWFTSHPLGDDMDSWLADVEVALQQNLWL